MKGMRRVAVALVVLAFLAGGALAAATGASRHQSRGVISLTIYLVRGERVTPVRRTAPRTSAPAAAALRALLRGPTSSERRASLGTTIPAGTRLRGVSIAGGVATVDLTRRFESGGGSLSMLLRVAQVVHTATRFATVHAVAFRLDGKPVSSIGGEGIIVSPPVGRAQFEGQAPPILVESPLPGDTVRAPLRVTGTANVFEARLQVDLVSASGRVLAHRSVLASAGTGTRGTFAVTLPAPAGLRRAVVVAYVRSAKDGRPVHVVRIPVAF